MESIKKPFESLIVEAEKTIELLERRSLTSSSIDSTNLRELLPQNGLWLIQRVLFYSIDMNKASVSLMKLKNVLPAILLIRSNFESAGVLANFSSKLKKFYDGNIKFDSLEQLMKRYALGSRAPELSESPDPIHILDGIRAADDWFKREEKADESIFLDAYNYLSEFAHPNFHGLSIVSDFNEGCLKRRAMEKNHENYHQEFLAYLDLSNKIFLHFYDECLELFKKNENLSLIISDE